MKTSKSTVVSKLGLTPFAWVMLAAFSLMPGLTRAQESAVQKEETTQMENSALTGELLYEILLGEMSLRDGKWDDAFSLLLDAARKTNDYQLYSRSVDIALQARSGDAAVLACKAWSDAYPQDPAVNEQLLQIYTAVNKTAESQDLLSKALAFSDAASLNDAIASIPRYYARAQNKAQAVQVVEQALHPYLQQKNTAATAYTTVGRMYLLNGDNAAALNAARKGHQADPQSIQPALLALELLGKKEDQATDIILQTLATQQTSELALSYARVLIELSRYPEAVQVLQEVTRREPTYAEAWLVLGSVQYELSQDNEADQALSSYLQLIKDKPDAATQKGIVQAQARRAGIAAKKGNFEMAMQIVDSIPASNAEEQRNIFATKIQLLRDQKQWQKAYDLLEQSRTTDLDLIYEQAMLAERLEHLDDMERLLRQIIQRDPKYYNAYNALGFSLAERGLRLKEAKSLISKAVELAPEDPYITDSLGWVEYRLGNLVSALLYLEKAYIAKTDPEIGAHLGEVLWKLKREDEALKVWKDSLALDPDNETLKTTITRFKPEL